MPPCCSRISTLLMLCEVCGSGRLAALDRSVLMRKTRSSSPPLLPHQISEISVCGSAKASRPSYADQVLALFRERGLKPMALYEVREVQTALGLVAAEVGVCRVAVSAEGLRRDSVVYRPLDAEKAVSPIIMSPRKGDKSAEIALILRLIREMYRKAGIAFVV